jgi:hypothetical protein
VRDFELAAHGAVETANGGAWSMKGNPSRNGSVDDAFVGVASDVERVGKVVGPVLAPLLEPSPTGLLVFWGARRQGLQRCDFGHNDQVRKRAQKGEASGNDQRNDEPSGASEHDADKGGDAHSCEV